MRRRRPLPARGHAAFHDDDGLAVCHGSDGAAKTAKGRKSKTKDVRLPEVQKMSDQQWYEIIVKGKGENMDSYRKELTDDQIHGLVEYVRSLAKQPPKS